MLTRREALGAIATTMAVMSCADDDGSGPTAAPGATSGASTDAGGGPPTPVRYTYGDDPSQWVELHLPAGDPRPGTVVVIHGGFWRAQFGADLGTPLAADLASRGWSAWNIEYRRVGNGGGWPETFEDVATAIDLLATVSPMLDLDRVVTLGHSAGGHLAAWAAARPGLPADVPGAGPAVIVAGVVSQAGVLDLRAGAELGQGAAVAFLGGTPDEVPERYDLASPADRLPIGVPVRCVHGTDDTIVPIDQSRRYVDAATVAGDDATLVEVDGDHFTVIDVTSAAWTSIVDVITELSAR